MNILRLLLLAFFGDPRAVMFARVLAAIGRLCPCPPGDNVCELHHERAAAAIAQVATDDDDPDGAAVLLIGAGAHETGFRTEREMGGGRAVSFWQVEVPRSRRAAMLADPAAAAHQALRAARACGGTMRAYACGSCNCGDGGRGEQAAAELRRYVNSARHALH